MGSICNNRATNKEFVSPSALFPEILLFGTRTLSGAEQERRVLWEALIFVAEPGRFTISSLVTHYHPIATFASFPGWAESQAGSAVPDLRRPRGVVIPELLCGEHLWDVVEIPSSSVHQASRRGTGQYHEESQYAHLELPCGSGAAIRN